MDSTSTIEVELKSEDSEVSIDRSRRLVAALDTESQQYTCQCISCDRCLTYGYLLPRFCIAGVVCPLLWLCNIALCFYLYWGLPAEPTHPPIPPEHLPTEYQVQANKRRAELELDPFTLQDLRLTNKSIIPQGHTSSSHSPLKFCQDFSCQDPLQRARYLFLRHVATQVIDTHRRERSYLARWLMLSTAALGACVLILATVLTTTVQH